LKNRQTYRGEGDPRWRKLPSWYWNWFAPMENRKSDDESLAGAYGVLNRRKVSLVYRLRSVRGSQEGTKGACHTNPSWKEKLSLSTIMRAAYSPSKRTAEVKERGERPGGGQIRRSRFNDGHNAQRQCLRYIEKKVGSQGGGGPQQEKLPMGGQSGPTALKNHLIPLPIRDRLPLQRSGREKCIGPQGSLINGGVLVYHFEEGKKPRGKEDRG